MGSSMSIEQGPESRREPSEVCRSVSRNRSPICHGVGNVRIGVGVGGLHHGGDGCQYSIYHGQVVNWCKGECIGKLFRSERGRWI